MEEAHGYTDPRMYDGTPPDEALWAWSVYFDKLRVSGFSLEGIVAYQQLSGITLASWEVELLFIIHTAVEGVLAKKAKEEYK